MMFLIRTSGRGILEAGRTVGRIEATDEATAEQALIDSGQIPEKARGLFDFDEIPQSKDEGDK